MFESHDVPSKLEKEQTDRVPAHFSALHGRQETNSWCISSEKAMAARTRQ